MTHMKNFYKIYMDDARARQVPILFVRFEDLVMDPEPELERMMKFFLGEVDLSGTNAERRVKEVIAKGAQATVTYQLKDTTRKYNSNARLYTEEQQEWIKEEFKDMVHFFGYAKVPQDPENVTGFFEYDGSNEQLNDMYRGYERHNEETLTWVHDMTDDELAKCKYQLSDKSKEVPLLDFDSNTRATLSTHNYFEKIYY